MSVPKLSREQPRASPRAARTVSRAGADIGTGAGDGGRDAEAQTGTVPAARIDRARRPGIHVQRLEVQTAITRPCCPRRHAAGPQLVESRAGRAGEGVGHSAASPITNLAAGIPVTTSSFCAVAIEGLHTSRRMRDTCTRLTPIRGASVPSCSAGLRSIHVCKAVMPTMYAQRTDSVKGDGGENVRWRRWSR